MEERVWKLDSENLQLREVSAHGLPAVPNEPSNGLWFLAMDREEWESSIPSVRCTTEYIAARPSGWVISSRPCSNNRLNFHHMNLLWKVSYRLRSGRTVKSGRFYMISAKCSGTWWIKSLQKNGQELAAPDRFLGLCLTAQILMLCVIQMMKQSFT